MLTGIVNHHSVDHLKPSVKVKQQEGNYTSQKQTSEAGNARYKGCVPQCVHDARHCPYRTLHHISKRKKAEEMEDQLHRRKWSCKERTSCLLYWKVGVQPCLLYDLRNPSNNLRTQSGELYCSPLQTARPATAKVQGTPVSLAQSTHTPRCGGELLRLVGMQFLAEKKLSCLAEYLSGQNSEDKILYTHRRVRQLR